MDCRYRMVDSDFLNYHYAYDTNTITNSITHMDSPFIIYSGDCISPEMEVTSCNQEIATSFYENTEQLSSSNPQSGYDGPQSLSPSAPIRKRRYPGPEGQERRRMQNRRSQQNYRERNKKAYEDICVTLDAERQTIAQLRVEVEVLESKVVQLQQEKRDYLTSMERICQSMRGATPQRG